MCVAMHHATLLGKTSIPKHNTCNKTKTNAGLAGDPARPAFVFGGWFWCWSVLVFPSRENFDRDSKVVVFHWKYDFHMVRTSGSCTRGFKKLCWTFEYKLSWTRLVFSLDLNLWFRKKLSHPFHKLSQNCNWLCTVPRSLCVIHNPKRRKYKWLVINVCDTAGNVVENIQIMNQHDQENVKKQLCGRHSHWS